MAYCTQQNLIDRFSQKELIELTDRAAPFTGAIVASVLDRAIADAAAEIDAHLSVRFTLPLASVPLVLERVACDITRYFLYDDRMTDQVKKRYEDAVRFLKGVADGSVSIGPDDQAQTPPESGGPSFVSPEREFTHDSLSGFL